MIPLRLSAIACLFSVVCANTGIEDDVFLNDIVSVVKAAAPEWNMDEATCFPVSATNDDGSQREGLGAGGCLDNMADGCPAQEPLDGRSNVQSTDFPTYYNARYCSDTNTWRVVYDVYFQKDSGHSNDWEWAFVVWERSDDDGLWYRAKISMEEDGDHRHLAWDDIDHTFQTPGSDGDMFVDDQKSLDHPRLFFGKWHHPVWDDRYTDAFANDCAVDSANDYRDSDYYYYSGDNLVASSELPADWTWDNADSWPSSFDEGGKYDICNFALD